MARLTVPDNERLGHDLVGSDMDLIEQLVEFRRLKNLTQQEVAERMGVDRSAVSRFESITSFSAKNHTMRTARKYAEAVGVYIAHVVVNGETQEYRDIVDVVEGHLLELRRSNEVHEKIGGTVVASKLRRSFRMKKYVSRPSGQRDVAALSWSASLGGAR